MAWKFKEIIEKQERFGKWMVRVHIVDEDRKLEKSYFQEYKEEPDWGRIFKDCWDRCFKMNWYEDINREQPDMSQEEKDEAFRKVPFPKCQGTWVLRMIEKVFGRKRKYFEVFPA